MSLKKWLIAIPVILAVAYIAGPSPSKPVYETGYAGYSFRRDGIRNLY